MKVLILCQRKFTSTIQHDKVKKIVYKISKFIEEQYDGIVDVEYTFLTTCMVDDPPDCADIKMNFNMYNEQTYNWVHNNKKNFDAIILNTCPTPLFPLHFWYGMWELLIDGGRLYLTAFDRGLSYFKGDDNVFSLYFRDGKDPDAKFGLPIKPKIKIGIYAMFNQIHNQYLTKKHYVRDSDIYYYLLNEACTAGSFEKLFPILPKFLQDFILEICNFMVKNTTKGNKLLAENIINSI